MFSFEMLQVDTVCITLQQFAFVMQFAIVTAAELSLSPQDQKWLIKHQGTPGRVMRYLSQMNSDETFCEVMAKSQLFSFLMLLPVQICRRKGSTLY